MDRRSLLIICFPLLRWRNAEAGLWAGDLGHLPHHARGIQWHPVARARCCNVLGCCGLPLQPLSVESKWKDNMFLLADALTRFSVQFYSFLGFAPSFFGPDPFSHVLHLRLWVRAHRMARDIIVFGALSVFQLPTQQKKTNDNDITGRWEPADWGIFASCTMDFQVSSIHSIAN